MVLGGKPIASRPLWERIAHGSPMRHAFAGFGEVEFGALQCLVDVFPFEMTTDEDKLIDAVAIGRLPALVERFPLARSQRRAA